MDSDDDVRILATCASDVSIKSQPSSTSLLLALVSLLSRSEEDEENEVGFLNLVLRRILTSSYVPVARGIMGHVFGSCKDERNFRKTSKKSTCIPALELM